MKGQPLRIGEELDGMAPEEASQGRTSDDAPNLRRWVRDLIALSALPAVWKSYDPDHIADSIAATVVKQFDAEFVYILLRGGRDEPQTEVTRTGDQALPEDAIA